MKTLFILQLLLVCFSLSQPEGKDCTEVIQAECDQTDYNSYVQCIRKRTKRSIDCQDSNPEDSCQQCDCDYCSVNSCRSFCNTCCTHNPPCTTNRCCHKTCHARCKSLTCRNECRRSCTEKINGESSRFTNIRTSQESLSSHQDSTTSGNSSKNITTIINLRNLINNTNVIDIPILLNNTNINNITLSGSEDSKVVEILYRSTGQTIQTAKQENCCYVVGPRQCTPTEKHPYIRCFHLRRRQCGILCRAPIVYEQQHEVCDQTPTGTSCHPQMLYIPQPQPRCVYQSSWPHVSCGLHRQRHSCSGCYSYYDSASSRPPPSDCPSDCYDHGLSPYYHQGPFYRPGCWNVPSCFQTGLCGLYGCGGFSSYGGFPNIYSPIDFDRFTSFPGMGYPPNTYENNMHLEQIFDQNVKQRVGDNIQSKRDSNEIEESFPFSVPLRPGYGQNVLQKNVKGGETIQDKNENTGEEEMEKDESTARSVRHLSSE